MRTKAVISALIVLCHFILMVWYYSHDLHWQVEYKTVAAFWFFGGSFILIGLSMLLTTLNAYFPIQLEITKFHSIFILLLGTIYGLHYTNVMTTNNREKLVMICAGVLLIFIIIMISAWRHGFFNKKTYD